MIVRILTARVTGENVAALNVLLRAQLDELRPQPGLVYAKLARRLTEPSGEEVVLFEEWESPAHVWAWASGRVTRSRLRPGTEELLEDLTIAHDEALDRDPWVDAMAADPFSGLPPAVE